MVARMTGTDKNSINHDLAALPQPVIVLVNPQMGENIGTTARAMLNCGLSHLRIVNPRDGWPNERATATSSGALDIMPPVGVFGKVVDAVSDCQTIYAATARPRDLVKPVMTPRHAAQDLRNNLAAGQKTAILFGAERAGLTNNDLAYAHKIITIPLNAGFSSLNLAQSVLLVAYEWSQFLFDAPTCELPTGKSQPATAAEFDNFFTRLDAELVKSRFYRVDEMKDIISRNIKSLFQRAQPTNQEINTLHGVLSALTRNNQTTSE